MWPVRIREHECGLLFHDGRFVRALACGTHWVWRPWRTRVVKITRLEPHVSYWAAELLLQDECWREQLEVVELGPSQRALIWIGDRLACVIGEGRHVFWSSPTLRIEKHDAAELWLKHPRQQEIIRHAAQTTLFSVINVAADEQLEVFENDMPVETLGPGVHVLWQGAGTVRWKVVPAGEISVGKAVSKRVEPESELPPVQVEASTGTPQSV